jgi:hypothetical protein
MVHLKRLIGSVADPTKFTPHPGLEPGSRLPDRPKDSGTPDQVRGDAEWIRGMGGVILIFTPSETGRAQRITR